MKRDLKEETVSDFEKMLEKKLKERDAILERELNLIFWGISGSASEDTGVRRVYDNDFIYRICHETRVNDIKISQVIRLGQRPKAETLLSAKGKPHGILVK